MQNLRTRVAKYFAETHRTQPNLFRELATGQKPEVLMIACSDSRVSPTVLAKAQLGELFTMRNAGNIVPPYRAGGRGEEATIEFAVEGLRVRDVIVLGHTHCGAMRGLMYPEECAQLPAMRGWLQHADAARTCTLRQFPEPKNAVVAELLAAAARENLILQLDHLKTHPSVRSGLAAGSLHIHAWFFDIEAGKMLEYDEVAGTFGALRSP